MFLIKQISRRRPHRLRHLVHVQYSRCPSILGTVWLPGAVCEGDHYRHDAHWFGGGLALLLVSGSKHVPKMGDTIRVLYMDFWMRAPDRGAIRLDAVYREISCWGGSWSYKCDCAGVSGTFALRVRKFERRRRRRRYVNKCGITK